MPRVLAIEPDPSQAAILKWVVKERVGAELVLADSKETAIAAIAAQVPDVIIAGALMSPRDEAELADHLRTLDDAEHLQILTIPLLAALEEAEEPRGRLRLNPFRRRRAKSAPNGCDPVRYGDELKGYVKLALEARSEHLARLERERRARELDGLAFAAPTGTAQLGTDFDLPNVDPAPASIESDTEPALLEASYDEPSPSEPLSAVPSEDLPSGQADEVLYPVPSADSPAFGDTVTGSAGEVELASVADAIVDTGDAESPAELPATSSHELPVGLAMPEAGFDGAALALETFAPGAVAEPVPLEPVPVEPVPVELVPVELAPAESLPAEPVATVEVPATAHAEPVYAEDPAPSPWVPAAWHAEPLIVPEPASDPVEQQPTASHEELSLTASDTIAGRSEDVVEPAAEADGALDDGPSFDHLLDVLPPSMRQDEEPVAFLEEDRISLSATSLDRDRQEATNWLWADEAVSEPAPPAVAAAQARPDEVHWVQSEATQPWHPLSTDGSGGLASGPEIWQALPDWVDGWPPLASWISVSRPARVIEPTKAAEPAASATEAAAAPADTTAPAKQEQPDAAVVDSRWIATALDALRSDIQMLRAAADHAEVRQPAPGVPLPDSEKPKKKKPRAPRPLQDEWGMFDPSQAGMEALLAALDAQDTRDEVPEDEASAADLLLRESAPEPCAMPDLEAEPSGAQQAPAAARPRLAPLAMWARVDREPRDAAAGDRAERDDLRELLAGLGVPAHVAAVSYPRGCRIRRVRMTRGAKARRRSGRRADPVIILPQKARGATEGRPTREPDLRPHD